MHSNLKLEFKIVENFEKLKSKEKNEQVGASRKKESKGNKIKEKLVKKLKNKIS